ncbi:DUF3772 domain-containing protein [Acetobacteraceae bacterium ESL0709]|nr:DUF3772 domain-containing protein [Acetobacteraceae bacterium ESL0697]MDF7677313.1 DUF3772 domain-containing protein [Acetobacteraceae bacterium ESL0709]
MRRVLRCTLIFAGILITAGGLHVSAWSEAVPQNNSAENKAISQNTTIADVMPRLDWNDVIQSMDGKLKTDNKTLQNIITRIKSSQTPFNQSTLQALRTDAGTVKDDTSSIISQLQNYDSTIGSVLDILGPKTESTNEDPSISRQRNETQKTAQLVKTLTIRARFYNLQARNLMDDLDTLRHKLQHATLSRRNASPVSLTYWHNLIGELPVYPLSLTHNHSLRTGILLATSTMIILCVAALGGLFLRRRLIAILTRWINHELLDARVAHRLIHCLCGTLLGGVAFLLWVGWSTIFTSDINETERVMGQTLPVCAFILGAGLPLGRLIEGKSNHKACLMLTLAIFCDALVRTMKLQDLPIPATINFLETLLSLITLGCCFALIPQPTSSSQSTSKTDSIDEEAAPSHGSRRFFQTIIWLYTILNAGWILTGYSALAFTTNVALVSLFYAASITGCFIGAWQAFITIMFSPGTVTGRHLLTLGLTRRRLDFLNVLISALGSLLFLLLFAALLTNGGDFTLTGIMDRLHHVFAGSTFHGVAVSPETLLGCLVLVIGSHYLIKGIRFWLDKKFFPTTTLTMGLRTSILSISTYCGWIVVGLVLLSLIGLSVQNLTWVVSALSVGVGFGLQSIVKDFISGLILLAERPIEAGDVIEVGGNRGEVKRVNVRTTDIRLGDGSTLIVPNSQFITSNVKNASFGNIPAKLTVSFTLPVNSDLDQASALIMKAAGQQKDSILLYPAPGISIAALNDMSVNLTLAVYVASPGKMSGVKTQLITDIFKLFQEARINLTMS